MLWAMGALLFQFHAVPQAVVPATAGRPAASKAAVEPVQAPSVAPVSDKLTLSGASAADETGPLEPGRLVATPAVAAAASPAASGAASPAPAASPAIAPVVAAAPRQPAYAARVGRGPRMAWIGLAVAGHSAAAFDAWSTRRAITQGGAQELNPLLKPFAGNRSIYAAVQIGPTLLDLLGRKMMTSRHPFLRHTWWLPQVLGTAASLAGGAHNLGVR